MWTFICFFTLYTKPNVVASIFKKQYNINEVIVNGTKNRGLKHRVPFSNAIEKNYMIHLKVIQKKLKYQCPKC